MEYLKNFKYLTSKKPKLLTIKFLQARKLE